jgi:predicted ATPase/DNA-binding XRE family transcriptional regulator
LRIVSEDEGASRFGDLLRRHRLQRGMTQAELSERALLSERTISDIERGLKLPQAGNVRRLADAMGLSPELTEQFASLRRRTRHDGGRQAAPERSLPISLTTFVGRKRELADVQRLLRSNRLLTLIGPGGTGKTRVALRAAEAVAGRYSDGVYFVDLTPLSDPRLVLPTVAQVLAVTDDGRRTPLEALTNALRQREVLLLLDNFEQVIDAAPDIGALLGGCPRVHVLVTSRAPLRIAGEQEQPIPPLDQQEAVWLFVERAQAANQDFALTADNSDAVAELCRRLDGLPLAIELAAARSGLLSPKAMLTRLERRLPLLTGGQRDAAARHRSLRDTIAWSYDLLEPRDRALFGQLSVFVGGCSLEAAQAVSGRGRQDALDGLDVLVGSSLLRSISAGADTTQVRVTQLETVREFGVELLESNRELESVRERHAAYFLGLAEQSEPRLNGSAAGVWIARLQSEHDNLRAALDWSLSQSSHGGERTALRLAGALGRFWWMAGYFGEGGRWLTRALAADDDAAAASEARMKALLAAGWLAHAQRDSGTANGLLEQSLAIAEARDDAWWQAWAVHALGRVAYFDDDASRAAELGQRSLAIAEELDDAWLIAWALHLLGLAAYIAGEYRLCEAYFERCLVIRRELGHLEGLFIVLHLKGVAVYRLGRVGEALELAREALQIARQLNSVWFYTCLLPIFAGLAAEYQPQRAARLGGVVMALSESAHTLPIPITEAFFDEHMRVARMKLGEAGFGEAWAQGQALSLESALAEAAAVEVRV